MTRFEKLLHILGNLDKGVHHLMHVVKDKEEATAAIHKLNTETNAKFYPQGRTYNSPFTKLKK